jgi:hypothetical protein
VAISKAPEGIRDPARSKQSTTRTLGFGTLLEEATHWIAWNSFRCGGTGLYLFPLRPWHRRQYRSLSRRLLSLFFSDNRANRQNSQSTRHTQFCLITRTGGLVSLTSIKRKARLVSITSLLVQSQLVTTYWGNLVSIGLQVPLYQLARCITRP